MIFHPFLCDFLFFVVFCLFYLKVKEEGSSLIEAVPTHKGEKAVLFYVHVPRRKASNLGEFHFHLKIWTLTLCRASQTVTYSCTVEGKKFEKADYKTLEVKGGL